MNLGHHGAGIFFWDNYAGHDYLDEAMKADCQRISEEFDFFDFVATHNGGYISRNEFLCWFHSMWQHIPKNMLYVTYKTLLVDTDWARGRWAFKYFFKPGIVEDIMKLNKHDTVENPVLRSLLDEDGYLTVYHGHCKKTMHNSNSWLLNKDNAIQLGRTYAPLHLYNSPTFYCVTGKVRLEDVITFIDGHCTHEIAVMNKSVINKTKEFFNIEDFK